MQWNNKYFGCCIAIKREVQSMLYEVMNQRRCWGAASKQSFDVSWQVQERYMQDGNDRLKLLVLLCSEDDDKLQRAAAGALAMLTAAHKKLCTKMTVVVRTFMPGLFQTSLSYHCIYCNFVWCQFIWFKRSVLSWTFRTTLTNIMLNCKSFIIRDNIYNTVWLMLSLSLSVL